RISIAGRLLPKRDANFSGMPKPIIARREPSGSAAFAIPATTKTVARRSLATNNTIPISTSMQNSASKLSDQLRYQSRRPRSYVAELKRKPRQAIERTFQTHCCFDRVRPMTRKLFWQLPEQSAWLTQVDRKLAAEAKRRSPCLKHRRH